MILQDESSTMIVVSFIPGTHEEAVQEEMERLAVEEQEIPESQRRALAELSIDR